VKPYIGTEGMDRLRTMKMNENDRLIRRYSDEMWNAWETS
jgi:hypothetical protein